MNKELCSFNVVSIRVISFSQKTHTHSAKPLIDNQLGVGKAVAASCYIEENWSDLQVAC